MSNQIDWTKPVETCEEPPRPVRVLATDLPGEFPIVLVVGDAPASARLNGDGYRNVPAPAPAQQPDPGEYWCVLGENDIVAIGDEYHHKGAWRKAECIGMRCLGGAYRRLVLAPQPAPVPEKRRPLMIDSDLAPEPGDGWRLLAHNEVITLGDEYLSKSKWFPATMFGFPLNSNLNSNSNFYRRRVPAPDTAKPAPTWVIFFEDQDHRPEFFSGPNAESVAMMRYTEALQSWSCHLFKSAAAPPALDDWFRWHETERDQPVCPCAMRHRNGQMLVQQSEWQTGSDYDWPHWFPLAPAPEQDPCEAAFEKWVRENDLPENDPALAVWRSAWAARGAHDGKETLPA